MSHIKANMDYWQEKWQLWTLYVFKHSKLMLFWYNMTTYTS